MNQFFASGSQNIGVSASAVSPSKENSGQISFRMDLLDLLAVQGTLKSLEYSLEGLMLKLKLQYFGHLMQRTDSFEKTLTLGKTEGRRRRGRQNTSHEVANVLEFQL